MRGTGRRHAALAAVMTLLVVGMCGASSAYAATVTTSGTLTISGVSATDSPVVSGTAAMSYQCTPDDEFDYCGSAFTYVSTAETGACTETGTRWVGELSDQPSRSEAVEWSEYPAGPRQIKACLYVYTGEGSDRLLDEVTVQIPAPAATPPPGGGGSGGGGPGAPTQACPNAFAVKGAAATMAAGRWQPITVSVRDDQQSPSADALHLEMVGTDGDVFYKRDFSKDEVSNLKYGIEEPPLFYMTLDRGDPPSFAQISWSGPYGCAGSARTGQISVIGGARGRLRVVDTLGSLGDDAGVRFGAAAGRSCLKTELRAMRVKVSSGGRTRAFSLNGACGEWKGSGASLPGVRASLEDGGPFSPALLRFTARPGAGSGGRRVAVTVRSGGRRVLRQRFLAVWDRIPDERIWQGTDRFWNYCINESKKTFSRRGRLYCVSPGLNLRYVVRDRRR